MWDCKGPDHVQRFLKIFQSFPLPYQKVSKFTRKWFYAEQTLNLEVRVNVWPFSSCLGLSINVPVNIVVSWNLPKIPTVGTLTKVSAKALKEDINNKVNTKLGTDGQSWKRLKWIGISVFQGLFLLVITFRRMLGRHICLRWNCVFVIILSFTRDLFTNVEFLRGYVHNWHYRTSSNNSRPLINRLPQIIAPLWIITSLK